MPSRFDSLFSDKGLPILLHNLGNWATYRPKSGTVQSPRKILIIDRAETAVPSESETTEHQREFMWVSCYRDATRGIDAPRLGDSLQRDELDAADSLWSFQGQVRNASSVAWELLFGRIRPTRYGGS